MKDKYIFSGKILPERCCVSLPTTSIFLADPKGIPIVEIITSIQLSQISITVRTSGNELPDIMTLKNEIETSTRLQTDILGYVLGCGYDAEITQALDLDTSELTIFGVGIPIIEQKQKSLDPPTEFLKVLNLFSDSQSSIYLRHCLADIREAIKSPRDTGFLCYRAIESLRAYFQNKYQLNEKKSWEKLRDSLNTLRADIDYIKEFADPVRHGHTKPITDEERATIFEKTWSLVDSFINYAKANQPQK